MLLARQVAAQPGPVEIVASAARAILAVDARKPYFIAPLGNNIAVAASLRCIGGTGDAFRPQHRPRAQRRAGVVDRPRLDLPYHRFLAETAVIVGIEQAFRCDHINRNRVDQRARRVRHERAEHRQSQCLLPGNFETGHHIGRVQGHATTRVDDLVK